MVGAADAVERRDDRGGLERGGETLFDLPLPLERVVDAGLADLAALDRANQRFNRLPLRIRRGIAQEYDVAARLYRANDRVRVVRRGGDGFHVEIITDHDASEAE